MGWRCSLQGWGCSVATALSASDALDRAQAMRPDVIIADYHLDDGTGIEAVSRVRAMVGAAIPALLLLPTEPPRFAARPRCMRLP